MNILFLISSLRFGGAEKQAVIDANALCADNNVHLIVFNDGELKEQVDKKVKLIILEKKGYISTAKKIRQLIIENKIEIVNSSLFASMIISVLACNKINVPVIWHFHSHEYDMPYKSKLAFKYFAKKSCLKKILFVSEELLKHFENINLGFSEERTSVLYNNITVPVSKNEKKNSNYVRIGYIGRIIKLKRVEYLIELAVFLRNNGINNFKIDIVGEGESLASLKKLAEDKAIKENVEFHGFRRDVEKYYDLFDIFALPSSEECLSISLMDACAKSLPCVAFNAGGNNEIIINKENGFIVEDKNEFFSKILVLIQNADLRKEMGSKSFEISAKKFNKEIRMEKLMKIFTESTVI